MALQNAVHGCQSDAAAFKFRFVVQAVKWLEQVGRKSHVKASAVVAHKQRLATAFEAGHSAKVDGRLIAVARVLPGVANQVFKRDACELAVAVSIDAWLDRHQHLPLWVALAQMLDNLCRKMTEVNLCKNQLAFAGACQGQQIIDQFVHPDHVKPDSVKQARLFIAEPTLQAASEQHAEALDAAQRRLQVVRHRIAKRLELGIGGLELVGAFAHALLQHFMESLNFPVAAQAHQLGRDPAGKNLQQRITVHTSGLRLAPHGVDDTNRRAVGITQRHPRIGMEAAAHQKDVIGKELLDTLAVNTHVALAEGQVARCACQHVVDVGLHHPVLNHGQRRDILVVRRFADHGQIGANRAGKMLHHRPEKSLAGFAGQPLGYIQQQGLAALLCGDVDGRAQHARLAANLDDHCPKPAIDQATVLAAHLGVHARHLLLAAQRVDELPPLGCVAPDAHLYRGSAYQFARSVTLHFVVGGVDQQKAAVRLPCDGHVDGAEIKCF